MWCCLNFVVARTTFSSLGASQIALVVARCEFCNRSHNALVTLGLWALLLWRGANFAIACATLYSYFGPVRSLLFWRGAEPSRHFVRVRSLSFWRNAHFATQGNLVQRSWQGGLFQKPCAEILPERLLVNRYCDIVQRPPIEILHGDLAKRSLTEVLPGDVFSRACGGDLATRPLATKDLVQRQRPARPWADTEIFGISVSPGSLLLIDLILTHMLLQTDFFLLSHKSEVGGGVGY